MYDKKLQCRVISYRYVLLLEVPGAIRRIHRRKLAGSSAYAKLSGVLAGFSFNLHNGGNSERTARKNRRTTSTSSAVNSVHSRKFFLGEPFTPWGIGHVQYLTPADNRPTSSPCKEPFSITPFLEINIFYIFQSIKSYCVRS